MPDDFVHVLIPQTGRVERVHRMTAAARGWEPGEPSEPAVDDDQLEDVDDDLDDEANDRQQSATE